MSYSGMRADDDDDDVKFKFLGIGQKITYDLGTYFDIMLDR